MFRIVYLLILSVLLSVISPIHSYATHNRAGEITYKQLGELTYKVIITTYTYTKSPADRSELTVQWGDGESSTAERYKKEVLPGFYQLNKYSATHTYPGPDIYDIVVQDPNRNAGVLNIPNSVQTVFAIKTTLKISSSVGYNNTPDLLTKPIDKAAKNELFLHNPSAYDPDGDSLSYELTTCLTEGGKKIEGYTLPEASNSVSVNPKTGTFKWDKPVKTGLYNVAIKINEWREGVQIGSLIRDMQIKVVESENEPPEIDSLPDLCVEAGDTVQFPVVARDDSNEVVTLTATGAPFEVENSPAEFNQPKSELSVVTDTFTWITNCSHVRKTPYQVAFKASDDHPEVQLTSFESVDIKVLAPAPENLQITPTNRDMTLKWDKSACATAEGYNIYRRKNPSGFIPDSCQTGVPDSAGFTKIAEVDGLNTTSYVDDNDQKGLWQGVRYCYRVTARFPNGAESVASEETCDILVRGLPAITNVDVLKTDTANGKISVKWAYPTEFDTTKAPGPYMYRVYHSPDHWGNTLQLLDSVMGLKNTELVHENINTKDTPHSYMVVFWNIEEGNRFPVGTPQIASSVFVDVIAGRGKQLKLEYKSNTPWTDSSYVIYRKKSESADFDSLTTTPKNTYVDRNLVNHKKYWYKVKSIGYYSIEGEDVPDPILNNSQIAMGQPLDTIPPCIPELEVSSDCEAKVNNLVWSPPDSCANDVKKYNIYFTGNVNAELQQIATVDDANDTTFSHTPEKSLAGCYAVAAVDSFKNESPLKKPTCVDDCYYYEIPNVFTPDGDNKNDVLKPFPYDFVEKVDLKIYNRWGELVFETTDPDINWDGSHKDGDGKVSEGVYYYVCDIYEHRLGGLKSRNKVGFIHVYKGQKTKHP